MNVAKNLAEAGITLPEIAKPLASYVPGLVAGNMVYISGQLPVKDGKIIYTGKLGQELSIASGQEASRLCAINCLAVLKSCLADWDDLDQVVKITGYVQCQPDFYQQAQVLNGASDLLMQIFETQGQHARAAIGVNSLPLNAACEVEMITKLKF